MKSAIFPAMAFRRSRLLLAGHVLGATLLAAAPLPVHADAPASATASAESQALFTEARALADAKKYAEACPKFEASLKLEPGVGTRFYLADCYEHIGRLASAWAMFGNAEEQAQSKAQEEQAHKRAAALQHRLVRVVIDVPEKVRGLRGLVVQRGEATLTSGQFGTAVPVDPGTIAISATASSKKRWAVSLEATKEGATLTVQVPMLEEVEASVAIAAPSDSASRPSPWSTGRIAGVAVAGLGVVTMAFGGGFGGAAIDMKNASERDNHCDQAGSCDAVGLGIRNRGRGMGDISTALFIVGGVFAAGGVALYLVAPVPLARNDARPPVVAYVGAGTVGVRGGW
jgi:hypothetical protein